MFRKSLGVFFILALPLISEGVDKSKKAYELIYEDIQILKQQLIELEEKIGKNSEDLKLLKDQSKELLAQFKPFQAEQASLHADIKNIPPQYQIFLEKIELMNSQLVKISEELSAMKSPAPPIQIQDQKSVKKPEPIPSPTAKKLEKESKEAKNGDKPQAQAISSPSLSPQEAYNMAYSDYLKGKFDLSIDGFKMYREQFPDSPLTDNALYWIGECYFSQKKYAEAINQFNEVIFSYPTGDKVAAAYLKKGISLIELKKKEEALSVLKLLVTKYPLEEETKIAQQKIKELATGK